jgi:hypothetical protein
MSCCHHITDYIVYCLYCIGENLSVSHYIGWFVNTLGCRSVFEQSEAQDNPCPGQTNPHHYLISALQKFDVMIWWMAITIGELTPTCYAVENFELIHYFLVFSRSLLDRFALYSNCDMFLLALTFEKFYHCRFTQTRNITSINWPTSSNLFGIIYGSIL